MPLNYPLPFGEIRQCQGCRHCTENKCWWFFPALDLVEILTVEERLSALEERYQSLEKPRLEVDRPHEKPKLAGGVRL